MQKNKLGLKDYLLQNPKTKVMMEQLVAMYPNTEEISPENVYREGSKEARRLIHILGGGLIKPGSKLMGSSYLKQLYDLSQQGKACLILAEHYSNMDLTNICYLSEQESTLGQNFVEKLIAIAGIKLSTENALVSAFIRAYNRLVIYPSRGLENLTSEEEKEHLKNVVMPINMASMKELTARKYNKQMVLVFPSGTRIRPWDDDTKKGVREIASYIKAFEYLCFVNINGNNLPINPDSTDMTADNPTPDLIWVEAHPVISSKEFLASCDSTLAEGKDKKTHIVNCVMKELFSFHDKLEVERQKVLQKG